VERRDAGPAPLYSIGIALATELKPEHFDVVLSGLHGGWGEDGTIQALLEVAGVPYVGSPQRSSVIAIDKQLCKLVMRDAGLNVARGAFVGDFTEQPPFLGPIAVKPNAGGSSVGVTLFRQSPNAAQWQTALCAALADGSGALVEELIEGIEVNAGVLGEGDAARSLPLIEIVPHSASGFYDYEAKYAVGGSEHFIPPRLPARDSRPHRRLRPACASSTRMSWRVALRLHCDSGRHALLSGDQHLARHDQRPAWCPMRRAPRNQLRATHRNSASGGVAAHALTHIET
jgi:D-alanine--D-alanine ligase